MLVGKVIGPFKIDKELGSGAMGSVYRGVYTKTGQKVAIKIMAPALASNEQAVRRFEREANILRQLNHPNVVRIYGAGKYLHMRYYAMEYIEGEPLDRVMARRGRMTWEEVVALGLQLCAALQHAHDKGVVHRDLKPSNLMILRDGTLKLTDFGIAKGLDMTQLTEANCTVGTAAYMSPEQCKGEPNLTLKSDLYSMGIVFYELVTGKKPFTAENAMDMFLLHVQGKFERPSRLVLDIPVWLDNLICQLMEKKPEHRPLNAGMVASTLSSIQEKVEAQQSAGVDAAKARRIDRPKNQPGAMDETDRAAARTLLGKKKKKAKGTPFYRTGWFVGLGVVAFLGGIGLLIWFLLRPPPAEQLYAQAEKLWLSSDTEDWDRAINGPIKSYLAHYGGRPGPQTDKVRQWSQGLEVRKNEYLLKRYLSKKNSAIKFDAQSPAEELGFKAINAEEEGDLDRARKNWEEMQKKFGGGSGYASWGDLGGEHLKLLDSISATISGFDEQYKALIDQGREPVFRKEEPEAMACFLPYWYASFGDPISAQHRFEDLHEQYAKDPDKRFWSLLTAWQARKLKEELRLNPDADKNRKMEITKKLEEASKSTNRGRKYGIYRSIELLYEKETIMKEFVEEAREQIKPLLPK